MKNKIGNYLLIFGIGLLTMFMLMKGCDKEPEVIEVPVKIEVPVPEHITKFDTVYVPKPIVKTHKIIDSTYYNKYKSLKDDVQKDSLFKEVIKINEYRETSEDSIVKVDLYLKVRGDLLKYKVDTKVKERTVELDTILNIPIERKPKLFLGGDIGIPYDLEGAKMSVQPGIILLNKSHNKLYKLSVDPVNKSIQGGVFINIL